MREIMFSIFKSSRLWWVTILSLGGLLLVFIAILATPARAPGKPAVVWTSPSVTQTLRAGESVTFPVSFTTSRKLRNVIVHVVPDLEPFVEVDVPNLGNLAKGQTITLNINISVPETATPDTFEGTIEIRRGSKAKRSLSGTLLVTAIVVDQIGFELVNEEDNYSVMVPLDWQFDTVSDEINEVLLRGPGRVSGYDDHYFADVSIKSFDNTNGFNLIEFYQQPGQIDYFQISTDQTFFIINGFEAVKFSGVFGFTESAIVSMLVGNKVVQIQDLQNNHQEDGAFDAIIDSISDI